MTSILKVDKLEGTSNENTVLIPTSIANIYLNDIFDRSYPEGATLTPTDIIALGPIVDPRAFGTGLQHTAQVALAVSWISEQDNPYRSILLSPGSWGMSSITIPENVSVIVPRGTEIYISAGSTVYFNGAFIAGAYPIFTGPGSYVLSDKTVMRYSEWNSTAGDYVTFNTFPILPSTDPVSNYQAVHKAYVDGVTPGAFPAGAIVAYGGSSAPSGYLLCDGTAVDRTTYAGLFAIIGTTYGVGNGATTFNLPDLCGKIPVGYDSGDADFGTLGDTGGEKTHEITVDEIPIRDPSGVGSWALYPSTTAYKAYHTVVTPHNNIQPYIVINYIIKT